MVVCRNGHADTQVRIYRPIYATPRINPERICVCFALIRECEMAGDKAFLRREDRGRPGTRKQKCCVLWPASVCWQ